MGERVCVSVWCDYDSSYLIVCCLFVLLFVCLCESCDCVFVRVVSCRVSRSSVV